MERPTQNVIQPQVIIAFSTAAAITAAAVAVSLQLALRRREAAGPQDILERCKQSIKSIERELEGLS
jgi:hypothetical protein